MSIVSPAFEPYETIFVIFVQIHILNRIGNLVVKQQKNFYEQKTLNCNEWDTLL